MNVPEALKDRPQWLCWKFITKAGQKKPAKMPYYATTGNLRGWPYGKPSGGEPTDDQPQVEQGHPLDREHLVDFEAAMETAALRGFDGVGFAFLPGDGLIGIDLDAACADKHASIRDACGTFAEASPSGTGLHIIGLGECETFKSNDIGIEVFCGRQFFTVTGNHDPASPLELMPIPADTLEKLRRTVERAKEEARARKHGDQPAAAPIAPTVAHNAEASRYCLAALESAVQRLRSATEGGRNDLLNGEAYGLAQLIHTGGISEATIRAALQDAALVCGLPPGEAKATISSGIRAGLQTPRGLPQREQRAQHRPKPASEPAQGIDPETGEIFEAPAPIFESQPLDVFGLLPPDPVPLDVLPSAIVDYVRDQSELTGSDHGILALSAIVSAAACITDKIMLQPKRRDPTWLEQARLWVAIVGDPSTKKSPAISKAVRHVKRIDHDMSDRNAAAMADYKWQHESWKEAKKADKASPPPEPQKPPTERLIVEDITVESLTDVLRDNPRGVLALKDELTGWFASMDAYKGGGKGASMDRAHWLEAYNGGRRVVDRVTRGTVIIPNWSACILGGVQPDMMRRVSDSMGNDGLLQRFIVLVARPAVEDADRTPDMRAMDEYRALFDWLVALQPGANHVQLSEDAHVCRERIAKLSMRLTNAFDSPSLKAWFGKWTGLFARLLLVYHVLDCYQRRVHPCDADVAGHTAEQVERLMCGTLLSHGLHFYHEILDAHDRQEQVRQLARLILAKRYERLTKRDMMQYWKAVQKEDWFKVRGIVDSLCSMGWLEPDMMAVDNDGRPRAWTVNPMVHEMFAQHADNERRRRKDQAQTLREVWQSRQVQ